MQLPDMWSDPLFSAIAESSPDTILVLDRDGRIVFANRAAEGLTVEGVLSTRVFEYVDASQHPAMYQCFDTVARTQEPGAYDSVYVLPSGEVTTWESRVGALVLEGEVAGFVVLCRNVTEQRTVAADRDRLFELSTDLMCTVDLKGRFRRVSPSFTRVLGHEQSSLLSRSFLGLVHPDDVDATAEAMQRLASGESVVRFEHRCRRRDGTHCVLQWHAVPDLERKRVHAVARDVTEHRLQEARRIQASKLEALGQLAGGIAHDFNNLLLAIQTNAELAARNSPEIDTVVQHLGEIQESARRAADLTQQMLAFGRQKALRAELFDLNALIEGLMRLLRRLIPENIRIQLEVSAKLPAVSADASQIEQVILNLCVNARDAMPKGGTLTLTTDSVSLGDHATLPAGRYVRLVVADTGVGIPSAQQQDIFDPFYTTKAPGEGVGLGLATVYGVLQQHGGTVSVTSEPGSGARFEVLLPAAEAPAVRGSPMPKTDRARGQETILVAEDEELVRRVVCRLLEEAGYRTISTEDGEQAVTVLAQHRADVSLALLDVIMPRMGGIEALQRMREISPGLRFVLTSGYTGRAAEATGLPDDIAFLPKPYGGDELLAKVRAVLDEPADEPSDES